MGKINPPNYNNNTRVVIAMDTDVLVEAVACEMPCQLKLIILFQNS